MNVRIRPTQSADLEATFALRESTRQNPMSRQELAQLGITPEVVQGGFASGELAGMVCLGEDQAVVGFCTGNVLTGEILVVALDPRWEGMGIGRSLLSRTMAAMANAGTRTFWLAASSDAAIRAHGFYRHLGWRPDGRSLDNGDQILVWPEGSDLPHPGPIG